MWLLVMSADSSKCSSYLHSLSSVKQMSSHSASVSESNLSAGAPSSPWWGLCFDPLTPCSHHLDNTSRAFFSSAALQFSYHCLSISLVPASPTTSAHCRLPSLPASLSFAVALSGSLQLNVKLLWFCPQQKPIPLYSKPFFFISVFVSSLSLCASSVAFIFIDLQSHCSLDFFLNKPLTLPMTEHCRQTNTALTFNAWCSKCVSEPHQLWTSWLNTNVKCMQLKQISMWLPLK